MARRGRPRKKAPFPKKYFIAGFFAVIAVLAFFTASPLSLHMPELSLFSITCLDTESKLTEKLEKEIVEQVKDKSLLTLDLSPVREEIMSRHPEIKELRLIKKFPSTLKIEIEEREPLFQLKENAYLLLGRDFVVIARSLDPFPGQLVVETVNLTHGVRPGDKIDNENVDAAVDLVRVLSGFADFEPSIILAHDQQSFSFYTHGVNIILGQSDFKRKLDLFSSLLKENFENDLARVRYVDLRYSKVYIGQKR